MKKIYEISRNEANLILTIIRKIKAPNAFLLGKVESFIDKNLHSFSGDSFRVTIESGDKKDMPTAEVINIAGDRTSR